MPRIKIIGPQAPVSLSKAIEPALPKTEAKKGKPYFETASFPNSSHLATAVWWSNGNLIVRFRGPEYAPHPGGNHTYTYRNVRKRLWEGLKSASSAGRYFRKYIRLSKPYERVA